MSIDTHEAADILLATAREYSCGDARATPAAASRSGAVVAAAYRLVATKLSAFGLQVHDHQDLVGALERFAVQAEEIA